jgi:antirestriction protein ArdC
MALQRGTGLTSSGVDVAYRLFGLYPDIPPPSLVFFDPSLQAGGSPGLDTATPGTRSWYSRIAGLRPQREGGYTDIHSEDNTMNKSLQKVIDTLQAHMAEGELVWHNPCLIKPQANRVSKQAYRGINQLMTAMVADIEGYQSPYWATFKQLRDLGGTLNDAKGKGVPIIFFKRLVSRRTDEHEQERFVIRHSCVFNLDLVSGLEEDTPVVEPVERIDDAEALAAAYLGREHIRLRHGRPAYVPALDLIRMPAMDEITATDEYYSTLFHELAHSTGHPRRLCRFGVDAGCFESREEYSKEELVAEITSALLCHDCGVDSQASIKNSAAYIQGWSRFIAAKAAVFLSAVNQAYKARACILAKEGG